MNAKRPRPATNMPYVSGSGIAGANVALPPPPLSERRKFVPPSGNWVITLPVLVKAALKSRICEALGLTKKPAKAGFGTKVAVILAAGRRLPGVPVSEVLPGELRLPVANVIVGAPVTSKSPSLLLSANVVTPGAPSNE